ncbi:MAG: TRAP transporter large permease subunit [Candidatus Aminicenantes bacterium]|nr:TRAP transporter large permease subunit [Candidatus Aminicenantes bacterium]
MMEKTAALLERVFKPVSRAASAVGAGILFVMVILLGTNIILRYLIRKPIKGTIELEEFMLVVLVFLGLADAAYEKRHIRIDLVISRIRSPVREVINSLTLLLEIGLCLILVWQAAIYALDQAKFGARSFILNLPIFPFILVVALGGLLLAIALLSEFLRTLAEVARRRCWPGFWAGLGSILLLFGAIAWSDPSPEAKTLWAFGILILFLALGMRAYAVMLLVGFLGTGLIQGMRAGFHHMGTSPYMSVAEYNLCVVAFFILMGYVVSVAGINRDLYYTADKWLGHFPGGLAIATVGGSAAFGAVCGDSLATSAVMATAALPEMRRYRYDMRLATGTLAAAGTLGSLIPPSISMIIYGLITDQSVSRLFVAGILPGLLCTGLFMAIIYVQARRNPRLAPPGPKTSFLEKLKSVRASWAMIVLFALVIGGIYFGIFTATEAGAMGACGGMIIGLFQKKLTRKNLFAALRETSQTVSMLLMIIVGAVVLGYFIAASKTPFILSDFAAHLSANRYVTLIFIYLVYAFLGCVMNIVPAMIITLPIFYPIIVGLGFDPIWFGIIVVLLILMGVITPPIGMNVFVIKGIAKDVPIETIFKGVLPFVIAQVICILILTLFPKIVLFLPGLMK